MATKNQQKTRVELLFAAKEASKDLRHTSTADNAKLLLLLQQAKEIEADVLGAWAVHVSSNPSARVVLGGDTKDRPTLQ